MKTMFRKSLPVFMIMMAFAMTATAQQFPSKWFFTNSANAKIAESWEKDGSAQAVTCGDGVLRVEMPDGSRPDSCLIYKRKPLAGPMVAGSSLVLEFPQADLPAGSFLDFGMTLSAEPGAPSEWQFEYFDGGQWVKGRTYRLYGSLFGKSHQSTTILETIRLSFPAKGTLKMRVKAVESEPVVNRGKSTDRADGYVVIQDGAFLGAYAQDLGVKAPKDTTSLLCIGNSFTFFYSAPSILKEIAWNEGHYLDLTASLRGGQNFGQHCKLNITADAIERGGFDYVILQDQSQTPARLGKNKKENIQSLNNAVELAQKVRTASPDCNIIVESTWSYINKNGDFGGFAGYKDFEKCMYKGAKMMAKEIGGAQVSRIEAAFAIVRQERPEVNLFSSDKKHQSMLGSYLKSCVNYLVIFGEPFGDSAADCGIEPELAAYFRSVAERVVLR